jgi:hypothetical protein
MISVDPIEQELAMTVRYCRLVATIAIAVIAVSIQLSPEIARSQTPLGTPDEGAVSGYAPNGGSIAYIKGTKLIFTNGVQKLGEVELDVQGRTKKLARVLQPNASETYVVSEDGGFIIVNSSNPSAPVQLASRKVIFNSIAADEKVTDFVQYNDSTFVIATNKKQIITWVISNQVIQPSKHNANMGTELTVGGGKLFVIDDGKVHELTPDGSGGWIKETGNDAGDAEDISVNPAGSTLLTGGSDGVKAWDIGGGGFNQVATRSIVGDFLGVEAAADGSWWIFYNEFGSPRCEKWSLDCNPTCALNEIAGRYLSLLGFPVLTPDPTDASILGVATGDGGVILQAVPPQLTETAQVVGLIFAHQLAFLNILGNPRLYAAGDVSGMWAWDMTDPLLPLFLNKIDFGFDGFFSLQPFAPVTTVSASDGAQPTGPYLVCAVAGGFNMYDLIDPDAPAFIDRRFTGGMMHDVAVAGDRAYGATDTLGLKIADLTNPTDMVLVKTVATPSAARRLELAANHAYVGTVGHGVRIIDISVDSLASEVGSLTEVDYVHSVSSDGSSLFVGSDSTIYTYDLTTPASPALVGSYTVSGSAIIADIGVVDVPPGANFPLSPAATKLAYVAAGRAGYVILDISNLASPVELFRELTADFASAVEVSGSDVYLADGGAGFVAYDVDPTLVPVFFQSVQATTDGRYVDISWDFSADEDVLGVKILRATGENANAIDLHAAGLLPASSRNYRDDTVEAGRTYEYTLVVKTADGEKYWSSSMQVRIPGREAALMPNYPNPFNPTTTIAFELPQTSAVKLAIYDPAGRHVVTLVEGARPAGLNEIQWDGTNSNGEQVSSGIYIARLQADRSVRTIKLTLLK